MCIKCFHGIHTMKKLCSAGAIITDGTKILLGHITGTPYWDIPKGQIDPKEAPIDTCIREVYEETGLWIKSGQSVYTVIGQIQAYFFDLGRYAYIKKKDLHLYLLYCTPLPNVDTLKCTSVYGHHDLPEIDRYQHVDIQEMQLYMRPALYSVIAKCIQTNTC